MRKKGWTLRTADTLTAVAVGMMVAAIIVFGFCCSTGKARQGTLDHNTVSAKAETDVLATADVNTTATLSAPIDLDANATAHADIAAMKAEIGEIRAALIGPVNVGPIGGIRSEFQAGGDLTTVDSVTSQVLAKTMASTLKWSVLISVITTAVYVLCHRFRSTRMVLDFCKGAGGNADTPKCRNEETTAYAAVAHAHDEILKAEG